MVRFWRRTRPLALTLLVLGVTATPGASAQAAVPSSPGPAVVLTGSGWGHSVGMSQYGAYAMSRAGQTAADILGLYYPGTTLGSGGTDDSAAVNVRLFSGSVRAANDRIELQGRSRTGGAPTSTAHVRMGPAGSHRDHELPFGQTWTVTAEGSQYVLRGQGENGTLGSVIDAAAESPRVSAEYGGVVGANPAIVGLPQLGSAGYQWGEMTLTHAPEASPRYQVVLRLPMGKYLRGIAEMPSGWGTATNRGFEALRAQAIAARSYAASTSGLTATPASQVYAGWSKEGGASGEIWVNAVDSTANTKVLTGTGVATTYYSSSHGLGRTENAGDSWAYGSTPSHLRSVADPWSGTEGIGNSYRSWTATASNAAFAATVGLARVNTVRIETRTEGGSPKVLVVDGWTTAGERLTCRWSGGKPCPENDTGAKGAGARLRGPTGSPGVAATTTRVDGTMHSGANLPSQQISSITLAPFTDDEDSVHQYNIGAVAAAGITTGCTTTTYCPKSAVTRGQMATFIARALKLPADTGSNAFHDIATSPHRGFINALARAGKVGGYADGSYRPDLPVTREQMASFLAAGFELPEYRGSDRFDDIATSFHRDRINATAERGIAGGCTASTYCPKDQVTREQMASFLARATGIGE